MRGVLVVSVWRFFVRPPCMYMCCVIRRGAGGIHAPAPNVGEERAFSLTDDFGLHAPVRCPL